MPPMDDAGRADAYCVVYLIGPDGAKTPSEGVTSRVCYRTTKPRYGTRGLKWRGGVPNRAVSVRLTPFSISVSQIEVLTHFHSWPGPCDGMANWFIAFLASVHRWMQTLELKLPGGKIGDRGFFVNDSAASSRVRIDVYDAQVCEHVGNFKGQRNGHICWPRDGFPSSLRVLELVERPAWPPTRNVVEFAQLWATPIRPGTDGCIRLDVVRGPLCRLCTRWRRRHRLCGGRHGWLVRSRNVAHQNVRRWPYRGGCHVILGPSRFPNRGSTNRSGGVPPKGMS